MGWSDGSHRPPQAAAFFYFVAFIVLCAFSLLNLYVGVIFYQAGRVFRSTSRIEIGRAA